MEKTIFSEDYSVFLNLLRKARMRARLTQAALAERVGQTQSFVSKCERGERRLDIVETRAFCRALGVPFARFIVEFEEELQKGQ